MILNLIILSIACCIDFFLFLALSLGLVDDHDTDYAAKLSFLYPTYKYLNKLVILTMYQSLQYDWFLLSFLLHTFEYLIINFTWN